jgi:acyl-CoA thioesterase-1
MMGRWRGRLAQVALMGVTLASLLGAGSAAAQLPGCPVPDDLALHHLALPESRTAVAETHRLVVLAIGSAPTAGDAAGDPAASYPARLQVRLTALLPGVKVVVVNDGVPQRSTHAMAKHMAEEVTAAGASLVLWEAGGREAARQMPVDTFADHLHDGLETLAGAQVDTILLDLQYAPPEARLVDTAPYREVIAEAAEQAGVVVLPRHALMEAWSESGALDLAATDPAARRATDRRLFDCLAAALAGPIAAAVKPSTADRARK